MNAVVHPGDQPVVSLGYRFVRREGFCRHDMLGELGNKGLIQRLLLRLDEGVEVLLVAIDAEVIERGDEIPHIDFFGKLLGGRPFGMHVADTDRGASAKGNQRGKKEEAKLVGKIQGD